MSVASFPPGCEHGFVQFSCKGDTYAVSGQIPELQLWRFVENSSEPWVMPLTLDADVLVAAIHRLFVNINNDPPEVKP